MNHRSLLAAVASCVAGVALAATFGPFKMSDWPSGFWGNYGPEYQTYSSDINAEYEAAMAFNSSYLSRPGGPLWSKGAQPGDMVRIAYRDGVTVEFELPAIGAVCSLQLNGRKCGFSPGTPLIFKKVVRSTSERASVRRVYEQCVPIASFMSIPTGFWSQSVSFGVSGVTVTAFWVNTGAVQVSVPSSGRCVYL